MKTLKFIILFVAIVGQAAVAQNVRFVKQGAITYEKKINIYGLIKDQLKRYPNNTWGQKAFEDYQKNNPQFKTLKSTLTFKSGKTYFNPTLDESVAPNYYNFQSAKQNNIIFSDLNESSMVSQKNVYEEYYLLKDSVKAINWKITDEFREIAGYNCRRANAVIMDSIYVVAFYTEKIPLSGGPESFNGLPGMILGVALPREHVTWFATKVDDIQVTEQQIKIPSKGKVMNWAQLTKTLNAATKDWGDWAQDILKNTYL